MPGGCRHRGAMGHRLGVPRLRGVVPGELGLRWVTCRCEAGGLDGQAQRGQHAARQGGVYHERRDGATTAARTGQHVLGKDAAEQVGPWQPAPPRAGGRAGCRATWVRRGGWSGLGDQRAELFACAAGRAEHPGMQRARAPRRCQAPIARTMRLPTQLVQAGSRARRRRNGLGTDSTHWR